MQKKTNILQFTNNNNFVNILQARQHTVKVTDIYLKKPFLCNILFYKFMSTTDMLGSYNICQVKVAEIVFIILLLL